MSEQDPYEVLGVPPTATPEQISHAYRALVRRHHPDSRTAPGPGDAVGDHDRALRQVMAAYATLHDDVRRAAYDRDRRARDAAVAPTDSTVRAGAEVWTGAEIRVSTEVRAGAPMHPGIEIRVGPVHYEGDTPPSHRPGRRAAPAGLEDLIRALLWGWR
ncbi:J domain-containing protein [Georgenia thermotolerans]|uniref:DnaJ domain-containing protein n=1 Tax=Georgenia thermotolerans TaxID=527326 RepID=A0A7J5URR2_9MICO|nr:J domain-containing protein [Georgenia thermotolerans]KAE8765039.1 DnaJ domain-containing protein [Georgenia thermotolerans]